MYRSIPSLTNDMSLNNDMNSIFKYNGDAKYSTKDLKGGYIGNNISTLDVYPNENITSVKIQLLDNFKDHHIVGYSDPAAIGCD